MQAMTSRKKTRPHLPYSIQDLWKGKINSAVKEKLEKANKLLKEKEDGKLETGSIIQEER